MILLLPWGGCNTALCIHGWTCGKWERGPLISPECPETRHTGKTESLICVPSLLQAVSVDFQKQKVRFMDGSSQKYHQLLIATGSQ